MTTTELIKILKDNECGGISHKPRKLSLTINGKYMPNPQITLSSTGDGVCGPEIDLDVDGEFYEEQEPTKTGRWIDGHCSECGCDVPAYIIDWKWQKDMNAKYCPNCGAKMDSEVEQ